MKCELFYGISSIYHIFKPLIYASCTHDNHPQTACIFSLPAKSSLWKNAHNEIYPVSWISNNLKLSSKYLISVTKAISDARARYNEILEKRDLARNGRSCGPSTRAYAIRLQFPIVRNKSSIWTVETFRRAAVVQFAIESIKLLFLDTANGEVTIFT